MTSDLTGESSTVGRKAKQVKPDTAKPIHLTDYERVKLQDPFDEEPRDALQPIRYTLVLLMMWYGSCTANWMQWIGSGHQWSRTVPISPTMI